MRKLTGSFILAMALFFLSSSTVHADEFSITMGIRARFNEFIIRLTNEYVKFGGNAQDSTLLLGPSLKLSYGKFFGGISYLKTVSPYSMEFHSVTADEDGTTDISMKDVDLLVGYMFHPRFGVLAGYKAYTGESTPQFDHSFDLSIKGPAIGLTYNYPLKISPLLFIANVSYMPSMEYSFLEGQQNSEQDMDGYSVEVSLTHSSLEKIAYTVGVKHQELKSDLGDNWRYLGLTVSVDYRF
ncbi:MAG: hypothetical protein JRJ65_19565 [Deltaproteobacteria bacterium]|nr:hypothetical protein [Deltaproteobacteria bacterium]